MGTIREIAHEQCTGCGACYNKCPKDAIKMEYDSEGFLFPIVNDTICIDCGLCLKSCPVNTPEYKNIPDPDCYAMWADDEIRAKSSSGGMFTVLAEFVLEQNGYVCGAAYTDDYTAVEHIIVSDKKGLEKLRGSKYVQSNTGKVYSEIKNLLDADKYVLFTGCPCQVAGLNAFLEKQYKKLITVDIVCHGAPSPVAYKKYLDSRKKGRIIEKVNFRDKTIYGWGTPAYINFADGTIYCNDCFKDLWYRGFLNGLNTRYSCSTCKYASPKRIGDITLGDFWGVSELNPEYDDKKGTGLIFLNTEKGKRFTEAIENKFKLFEKVEYTQITELAKRRNGQLLAPRKNHWARKRFFELLQEKSYDEAFDRAVNNKFDVGITGWWYNENYGGALTYFALHQVVKSMGLDVLMIAKASKDPNYKPNKKIIPYRFALKHYNISANYHPNELGKLNGFCRNFISGSDQLFNPVLWTYSGPQYFLDYVSPLNNKIAYGSSFGNEYVASDDFTMQIAYWLRRFDYLSVREDYAVDIMQDKFGLSARHVLDPVFLCDVKEYEKLAAESAAAGKERPEKYILSFFLDPDEQKRKAILDLSEKLDMPYINLVHATNIEENVRKLNLDNTKEDADIEDWLYYYQNSSFVITDSFHGTCFAIIFQKPFISVANIQRGANRFESLLRTVQLQEHLTYDVANIMHQENLFNEIDYRKVSALMQPMIQDDYNWLREALLHPAKNTRDEFKVVDRRINDLKLEIIRLQQMIAEQNERINKSSSAIDVEKEEKPTDKNTYVDNIRKIIKYGQKGMNKAKKIIKK